MFVCRGLVWVAILLGLPLIGSAAVLTVNCDGTPVISSAATESCSFDQTLGPFQFSTSATASALSVSVGIFGNPDATAEVSASASGTVQILITGQPAGTNGFFVGCSIAFTGHFDNAEAVLDGVGLVSNFQSGGIVPSPCVYAEVFAPDPQQEFKFQYGVPQDFSYSLSASSFFTGEGASVSFGQPVVYDESGNYVLPGNYSFSIAEVPEPVEWMLGLTSLSGMWLIRRVKLSR